MPRFPGYGFPFQYYRPYKKLNSHTPLPEPISPIQEIAPPPKQPQIAEPVWLDLFGIKLYFDDVLILSLLFFLYKEEVKDEGLFLALVLLLISWKTKKGKKGPVLFLPKGKKQNRPQIAQIFYSITILSSST